jgi:hypothetical protein
MATPPESAGAPAPPAAQQPGATINLGSQSVIGIKAGAAVLAILVLIIYILLISYFDSPYWVFGIIFGGIGVGLGIAGVFVGNLKISRKRYVPSLNILLIIISIIFMLIMPIFGNWEDPGTIGKSLWDFFTMFKYLIFAIIMLCYIELAHASIRFSQIDDYSTSHNLKEFNINAVINNYFMWFGILVTVVFVLSLVVIMLQVILSGVITDAAPQFGNSLEYNSPYSLLMSIAIVFVPIGIILTFVFNYMVKSKRTIVVKGREDIVALRPDQVKEKI